MQAIRALRRKRRVGVFSEVFLFTIIVEVIIYDISNGGGGTGAVIYLLPQVN